LGSLDVGSFSGRINRIAGAEGETFLAPEFSLAKFTILAKIGHVGFAPARSTPVEFSLCRMRCDS
jgi:hypothetical protein